MRRIIGHTFQERLMKKRLLTFGAFVAVLFTTLHAQDIAGIWQGTAQIQGRDIRLQFKVTNDDGLKGLMYSLDQGPGATPATGTVQSGVVKFAMPGIGGAYE